MASVVVMEDDETLRMFITSVLFKYGHEVVSADNGHDGLALVRQFTPDVIISDLQMPQMDGLEMLAKLRQEPLIAATPVILITSLGDRTHMRIGMTAGADDYLVKPFRPAELGDAVKAQLDKRKVDKRVTDQAVNTALDVQKDSLVKRYEKRLFEELNGRWYASLGDDKSENHDNAVVLVVKLISSALSEQLSSSELVDIVKRAYRSGCDTVNLFGARHVQLVGERLVAVFVSQNEAMPTSHHLRAVRAALGLVDSVGQIGLHLKHSFADRDLPSFQVGVALHTGPVAIASMSDPMSGGPTITLAVGHAVNLGLLLHEHARIYNWRIICSSAVLDGLGAVPRKGKSGQVRVGRKSHALDVVELLGLA